MSSALDAASWTGPLGECRDSRPRGGAPLTDIVGSSAAIVAARKIAEQVAPSQIPVLIVGETGTGKELFARYIHERSGRTGDLACVDCASVPDDLAESILFGHNRGAFTGAVQQSEGLVSQAHGGTLFLDELSSLSSRAQAKLLRVLETGQVQRLGATTARAANFRVVATVQEDFSRRVSSGEFRDDLVQRIAGVIVRLPSLDDRGSDIVLLARHFARTSGVGLTQGAEDALMSHSWPGNVRELRWTIARAAIFARSAVIDQHALDAAHSLGPRALLDEAAQDHAMHRRERYLRAACEEHGGNAVLIARSLGIGRSTLYRWAKDAGVNLEQFRGD